MSKHRIACLMLSLCLAAPAAAQFSVGIGLPSLQIGINLPLFPQLVRVPGYPVYYAPDVNSNYFFYDGLYWVYQRNDWYASSWYNGPWGLVDPGYVPAYVLRIPVGYYRQPPRYFHGWARNEPPRWDQHWGDDWSKRRNGWNQWNHKSYRPAPLPTYQRDYSGDRYPSVEKQSKLRGEKYRYQPKTRVVRKTYESRDTLSANEEDRRNRTVAAQNSQTEQPESKHGASGKQDRGREQGGGGKGNGGGNDKGNAKGNGRGQGDGGHGN